MTGAAPAFLLLLAALFLLWLSNRLRRSTGLPDGEIIYNDMHAWEKISRPYYDHTLGLVGKPDYVIRQRSGALIPVEIKSGRTPQRPHESHVYQLAAYCLLIARQSGKLPPYGVIQYPQKTFQLEYTPEMEAEVLDLLDEIRAADAPHRSHNAPQRCAKCAYRSICDETLA